MPFLRNAWYVAGWSETLTQTPQYIKLLGQGVALYRLADGTAVALADRCPHRFASLSGGIVVEDTLQCPYHGLRFDRDGRCVHNPHGDGAIPPNAAVQSFPLIERYHALWIWMGDAHLADPALIPDFSPMVQPDIASSRGYLHVAGNYQLAVDNLLDLSHVAFLHNFLTNPDFASRTRTEVKQAGNAVWSYMWNDNEPHTPLIQLVWDREEDRGDMRAHMRWTPPSNLFLDVGVTYLGHETGDGPSLPSAHLLTPETETTTHYFWTTGRNRQQDNSELGAALHEATERAFGTEDEPMIARVAQNMEGEEFWALNPVILKGDAAAVRARRILAKLIREESSSLSRAAE